MKKIYKYLVSASLLSLLNTGCDDFLERSAQDLVIPQTVEHYKEILQGDGYLKKMVQKTGWVCMMTDDVEFMNANALNGQLIYTASQVSKYRDAYRWQREIENSAFQDEGYVYCYNQILIANVCLEGIETADGTQEERETVEGQAKFQRAMAYFYLANLYAQAYNEARPTDLCVPLKLDATPELGSLPRATVEQVWGQIVSDCKDAVRLLEDKTAAGYYEINYRAALLLAARVALFMENFEDAITYGEDLLELQNSLQDITGETQASTRSNGDSGIMNFLNTENNPEIIWAFNDFSTTSEPSFYNLTTATGTAYLGFYLRVSSQSEGNLFDMYEGDLDEKTGDRRKVYWFLMPTAPSTWLPSNTQYDYRILKYDYKDKASPYLYQQMLRVGEAYLILAEAYARQSTPDTDQSLYYLNALRSKRINPYTSLSAADFPDTDALVKFIWEERRRELCFEECFRWWDLRRTGQPSIEHRYTEGAAGYQTFVLDEKDPAYILNFPILERENDLTSGILVPNARPDRLPVK